MTTTVLPTRGEHGIQHGRRRLRDLCPTGTTWSAAAMREAVDASLRTGKPAAFELSHLDIRCYGDTPADHRRARAAVLLVLALPGSLHFHEAGQWDLFGDPDETPPSEQRLEPGRSARNNDSLARLCRSALLIRRNHTSPGVEWLPAPPAVLSFRRTDSTTGVDLVCTLNTGVEVATMPCVGSPALSSSYYGLRDDELLLPPNTVVWTIHRHTD